MVCGEALSRVLADRSLSISISLILVLVGTHDGMGNTDSGVGNKNEKGKERASGRTASDAETLSSDEDVGSVIPRLQDQQKQKGKQYGPRTTSPDPLDCFGQSSSDGVVEVVAGPVERKPTQGPDKSRRRLPPDGQSTRRLQEKHKEEEPPPVIDLDPLSDDVESASGFDREDEVNARFATPNGRSQIPTGEVKRKIQQFERGKLQMEPQKPTPFLNLKDLKSTKSIVREMKPKNAKVVSSLWFIVV